MRNSPAIGTPLAEALRPATTQEVIGQAHLLGEGMPLRQAMETGIPHSMILWGPPGVGKTTIGRLAGRAFDGHFVALSAVLDRMNELRAVTQRAQIGHERTRRKTLLFVDEVHQLDKRQQDLLLPLISTGVVTLIGATTENPSFALGREFLAQFRVHVLAPLANDDLHRVLKRALDVAKPDIALDDPASETLINYADGDARRLLNLFEQVRVAVKSVGEANVSPEFLANVLTRGARRFDKGGEQFYDQISALHKSVRGSNPDAALYWLSRMLDGGVNRKYIARRIMAIAWDDIGLADPQGIRLANDAVKAHELLGEEEGDLALAQAVLYLACAEKSNAGGMAFARARAFILSDRLRAVPPHLRSNSLESTQPDGKYRSYRNPHDEPHGYASRQHYLPEGIDGDPHWYRPVPRGLEARISDRLAWLRGLDRGAPEPD